MRRKAVLRAAALIAFWQLSVPAGAAQGRTLKGLDVCQLVPGELVAKGVGGTLAGAKAAAAPDGTLPRCVYQVVVGAAGQQARKAYVIHLDPPADFQELRKFTEGKITDVPGLGDGAYAFQDPGDGRFKIRVLKRDDVMIEATADSADGARQVAGAAVAALNKKPK